VSHSLQKVGYFEGKKAPGRYDPDDQNLAWHQIVRSMIQSKFTSADAWRGLPLVTRFRLTSTKGNASRVGTWPDLLVGQPFGDGHKNRNKGVPFLFFDISPTSRSVLTLVLYDWSELTIEKQALEAFGFSASGFHSRVVRGSRRGDEQTLRWEVSENEDTITISSGSLTNDDVEPSVGRFALGEVSFSNHAIEDAVAFEVLALPRLSSFRTTNLKELPLSLDEGAGQEQWEKTIEQTYAWRGAVDALLGWLELVHGDGFVELSGYVEATTTEDVSPLAMLPLLSSLEAAASSQRRLYQRQRRTLRAPTGTLRVSAYMNNLAIQRPDRVPVERFDLTCDTPENRLFKSTAGKVRRVLASNKSELSKRIRRRFERVESQFDRSKPVSPNSALVSQVLARPLPDVQREATLLCQAMLQQRYPGLELDGDSFASMRGFELNIAALFEAAAREALARCCSVIGVEVEDGNHTAKGSQHASQQQLYWHDAEDPSLDEIGLFPGNNTHVSLLPDFVMTRADEVIGIGDAKYKRSQRRTSGQNKSHAPLRRGDLHQLVTYMAAWPEATFGVVIFPGNQNPECIPEHATRLLSVLTIGERKLGVFDFNVRAWKDREILFEPLSKWLEEIMSARHLSESLDPHR